MSTEAPQRPAVRRRAIVGLAVSLGLIALLYFLFERTIYGKALRATAVYRRGAKLMGIPTEFAGRLSFFLCA